MEKKRLTPAELREAIVRAIHDEPGMSVSGIYRRIAAFFSNDYEQVKTALKALRYQDKVTIRVGQNGRHRHYPGPGKHIQPAQDRPSSPVHWWITELAKCMPKALMPA
jgi:hypothetical protein